MCAIIVLTYLLETVIWKHCKPTYHLMTSETGILSCILTSKINVISKHEWIIINLNLALNLMTLGISMYSQTKTAIEQISHKTVYCSASKQIPLLLSSARFIESEDIFIQTFVTVFIYTKIIAKSSGLFKIYNNTFKNRKYINSILQ